MIANPVRNKPTRDDAIDPAPDGAGGHGLWPYRTATPQTPRSARPLDHPSQLQGRQRRSSLHRDCRDLCLLPMTRARSRPTSSTSPTRATMQAREKPGRSPSSSMADRARARPISISARWDRGLSIFGPDGQVPSPPGQLVDNPDSWLGPQRSRLRRSGRHRLQRRGRQCRQELLGRGGGSGNRSRPSSIAT